MSDHEHYASEIYFDVGEGMPTGYLHGIIADLRREISNLKQRVKSLESQTPQARQAQYEADIAMADARQYEDWS